MSADPVLGGRQRDERRGRALWVEHLFATLGPWRGRRQRQRPLRARAPSVRWACGRNPWCWRASRCSPSCPPSRVCSPSLACDGARSPGPTARAPPRSPWPCWPSAPPRGPGWRPSACGAWGWPRRGSWAWSSPSSSWSMSRPGRSGPPRWRPRSTGSTPSCSRCLHGAGRPTPAASRPACGTGERWWSWSGRPARSSPTWWWPARPRSGTGWARVGAPAGPVPAGRGLGSPGGQPVPHGRLWLPDPEARSAWRSRRRRPAAPGGRGAEVVVPSARWTRAAGGQLMRPPRSGPAPRPRRRLDGHSSPPRLVVVHCPDWPVAAADLAGDGRPMPRWPSWPPTAWWPPPWPPGRKGWAPGCAGGRPRPAAHRWPSSPPIPRRRPGPSRTCCGPSSASRPWSS